MSLYMIYDDHLLKRQYFSSVDNEFYYGVT